MTETRKYGSRDPVLALDMRQYWANGDSDFLRQSWVEARRAIEQGDRERLVTVLRGIYDIAPKPQIEDMADRLLAGVQRQRGGA